MRLLPDVGRLYRRYMALHAECRFPPQPLATASDDVVGYVEDWTFTCDKVRLRGWTLAHQLTLEIGGRRHPLPRRVQRGDVMSAMRAQMSSSGNQHGLVGFDVTLPLASGPARLVAEDMPDAGPWTLPVPQPGMIWAEKRRTRRAFMRRLIAATPAGLRYVLGGRRRADRDRVRALMDLHDDPQVTALALDPAVLPPAGGNLRQDRAAGGRDGPAVTIIMPVYNAFDVLTEALDRVERHTDACWHLVLIEDASPDARVRPFLRQYAADRGDRVTLLQNDSNLGFVGSVNRALGRAAQREGAAVILLNTDALVPQGWASRLLRPILDDDRVASVTPMSNDATILSVPWIAGSIALQPGMADRIDATARMLPPGARVQVPTGVGFCMAIARAALDKVPALDTAFGRGYGEEVDWCRKTAAAGMVHVGIGNLFVEHRGGVSFGNAAKSEALESSARIIRARYPEFDDEVRRFIASDPLLTARLALALSWAAETDPDPVHVYLAHALGGGAEHWLAARLAARVQDGRPSVVVRVGGRRRFAVELHADGGVLVGEADDMDTVRRLILTMPRRRMIYSCGVGDDRPWELPELLCDLAAGDGSALEILFHDYFPISPSFNLMNADGRYGGVPRADSTDSAHQVARPDITITLPAWRQRWGAAIAQARQLTVFSRSSRDVVAAAWPDAVGKIVCQPHAALVEMPLLTAAQGDAPGAIGVLGAIGAVKGAQVVSELAYHLDCLPGAPRLVIVGEFDHSFPLPPSVKVTGRYDPAVLPQILAAQGITTWLMPSVWPETFSFTTREMLATGLPVMAFDLGAQAEAVRDAPNGHIVAPDPVAIHAYHRRLHAECRE